jgi:hypothetical protein
MMKIIDLKKNEIRKKNMLIQKKNYFATNKFLNMVTSLIKKRNTTIPLLLQR